MIYFLSNYLIIFPNYISKYCNPDLSLTDLTLIKILLLIVNRAKILDKKILFIYIMVMFTLNTNLTK